MSVSRMPRIRTVDPHTVSGGGPDLSEMIKFKNRTWILIKCLVWPFKHRVLFLIVLTVLATMIFESAKWYVILLNLLLGMSVIAISLYSYTYYRYAYAPTLPRLTVAIRRRWLVHKRWPNAIEAAGFHTRHKLRKVKYTPNGMVGHFACDEGKTSQDLANKCEEVAGVLRANEVKIDATVPFTATVSIIWGDPTDRMIFPEDLSPLQTADQNAVTFALDGDHKGLELSISTSILIIGESDSGKSNCFWSVLNGLNEKNIPYKLWVIDPAGGVELDALENSHNTVMYASRASQSDGVIDAAHKAMEERLEIVKGDSRKYKLGSDFPLNIVVIDELLLLPRVDHDSNFGHILSSGRKAGFIVIALSQLSQVDALGRVRDLFPQRICHATKSAEMTDAALGTGSETAGANCSKISKRTPGVGYYFNIQTRIFTRFRTPLISDPNSKIIANGLIIQKTITNEPRKISFQGRRTAVYQYYGEFHGELGRLLYVGIAYDPKQRWSQHCQAENEKWCPNDVDPSLTEIEWFPNRKAAKARETELIRSEHPVYNKQERDDYASV